MNLTKSDKMIAIIGVVILIVAAVGIVYYYWTYEEPEEVEIEPTMKTYKVTWATDSGNLLVGDAIWVDKKGAYNCYRLPW
jgi:flagellar basal body-associated protein FliL